MTTGDWATEPISRRLTILVDRDLIAGSGKGSDEETLHQAEADEAASDLLGLPWELFHDDAGYLFSGPSPVRIRRPLPNRKNTPALVTAAPLRVLLVSPRPEDERASYMVIGSARARWPKRCHRRES